MEPSTHGLLKRLEAFREKKLGKKRRDLIRHAAAKNAPELLRLPSGSCIHCGNQMVLGGVDAGVEPADTCPQCGQDPKGESPFAEEDA